MPIFDLLMKMSNRQGISVIYITPLRALNRDLLSRLNFWSSRLGFTVEVRHGDTPAKERRKQAMKPPDFLVTTPETLQAILPGKRMRSHLRHVRWVVIDEVHQLAGNRRGAQLMVGLERLQTVSKREIQRIGLSATVGNPEEISSFVAGNREIQVVQVTPPKEVEYSIEFPHPTDEDNLLAQTLFTAPEAVARLNRIWELVEDHNSTLIFVNSRSNSEMIGSKFHQLKRKVGVHHGSLPKDERIRVENDFKNGRIKALVCTSTLELGIDIGNVDLTIQYMSPRQVSSLIQRVGRSGHRLDSVSKGTILAVSSDDLMESVAVVMEAQDRNLEPVKIHEGALDVLAHQIAGIILESENASVESILTLIKRAYPYRNLTQTDFDKVVKFLEKMRHIRISKDNLSLGPRTRQYYFENLSMIPDERRYDVIDLSTQQSIGILGEEFMVTKARKGLRFIIKGKIWEIQQIAEDAKVYVTPVEDPTAAIPGWDGEMLPLPFGVAQKVGRLRAEIADAIDKEDEATVISRLKKTWPIERFGLRKITEEITEHKKMGAPVASNRKIVLESFDRYVIVHSCFGDVVNKTLGEVFEKALSRKLMIRNWWADGYRILLELISTTEDLQLDEIKRTLFEIDDRRLEEILSGILRHSPFGYYMKFIAERFGALKRGLTCSGDELNELALRFRMSPIYDETIREALMLHLDYERVKGIYHSIRDGSIQLSLFRAKDHPSPFAFHLLNKHIDVPELIAPETIEKDTISRLRYSLDNMSVDLVCFECGNVTKNVTVKSLPPKPSCSSCKSGLLAVSTWSTEYVSLVLEKKLRRENLDDSEVTLLAKTRRSADLVLSYGRRAVCAQCVYGIGPQTASRILAKMHDDERDFYKDLLEAKLRFITTRPFWGK